METVDHTRPFIEYIKERGAKFRIYPQSLIEQFETLPRELFVPEEWKEMFHNQVHLDVGYGGLLSQPGLIFDMVASLHLSGKEKILEAGTGTGYQTAILARLSHHVYTIECDLKLLERAQERLAQLDIRNVTFIHGDAAYGLPQQAPFDCMIFGCAIHGQVDQHLLDQMAASCSRLVIPTGTYDPEEHMIVGDLLLCNKRDGAVQQKLTTIYHGTLSFFPLITSRTIGWTATKDGYVASSPLDKKSWFPWFKPR